MYNPKENTIDGFMTDAELVYLFELASQLDSIVEVGSWKGRSSHALLSGCGGNVYCVDHFQGSSNQIDTVHKEAKEGTIYQQFVKNVGHFTNLNVIKMESEDAANTFLYKSVDAVFIDGNHSVDAAEKDILMWYPKCKKILFGHDYHEASIPQIMVKHKLPIVYIGTGSLWFLPIP